MKKMSSKTGPIVTKRTKSSEDEISKPIKGKGMSKSVGTSITKKKGMMAPVTRHGFLRNAEKYK